jgi:hypothetical protein
MRLKAHEVQMLAEMKEHYEHRVQQASFSLQRHDANPMFRVQAERDRLRAALLHKIIEQTIVT